MPHATPHLPLSRREGTFVCIYCEQDKEPREFNTEHVMPQCFGKFENNLTLNNIVCEACNSYFARELEPWLARDSVEGFERFRRGFRKPSEFKSQGNRSTTKVQIPEGLYAGAWGFVVKGGNALGATPFAQVGFAHAEDGPFEWHPLESLPSLEALRENGYVGNIFIRLCECKSSEAVREALKAKGFEVGAFSSFDAPNGIARVEVVFRPGVAHRRGLAKILFNYLAHEHGAKVALESRFNELRGFIRNGTEPQHAYYRVDSQPVVPINPGNPADKRPRLLHFLAFGPVPNGIGGFVSLFNRLRHTFLLTRTSSPSLDARGTAFDPTNRLISPMTPPGTAKTLKIRSDFIPDIRAQMFVQLSREGYAVAPSAKPYDVAIMWCNTRIRHITKRRRRTHWSNELRKRTLPADLRLGLRNICRASESGKNLNPHLSRKHLSAGLYHRSVHRPWSVQ